MIAVPGLARADFTVSVRSLKDMFLGNDQTQVIQNALAANPVTVTVTDVEGIQGPVRSTFNANQLKEPIRVPTGDALTLTVVFSCPGLREARLDGLLNIANTTFEVAMPQDVRKCPTPIYFE